MRLAASRAVILESSRGWRLDKLKQAHKIDVMVALSMAALAAVRGQERPGYDLFNPGLIDDAGPAEPAPPQPTRAEQGTPNAVPRQCRGPNNCLGTWQRAASAETSHVGLEGGWDRVRIGNDALIVLCVVSSPGPRARGGGSGRFNTIESFRIAAGGAAGENEAAIDGPTIAGAGRANRGSHFQT
jgi:hypothetical protein